jgi:hypothetical protein
MSKNTTIPPHSVEVKIKGKKTVFRFRIKRFFGFDFKQNRPSLLPSLLLAQNLVEQQTKSGKGEQCQNHEPRSSILITHCFQTGNNCKLKSLL